MSSNIKSENMCRQMTTYRVTDHDVSLWQAGSVWEGPVRVPGDQEARFYFVSLADLLNILSQGNQPVVVRMCNGLVPQYIGSYCYKQLEPLQYCKAYYILHVICSRYIAALQYRCGYF